MDISGNDLLEELHHHKDDVTFPFKIILLPATKLFLHKYLG